MRINRDGALFQGTYFAVHLGGAVALIVLATLSMAAAIHHAEKWWRAIGGQR